MTDSRHTNVELSCYNTNNYRKNEFRNMFTKLIRSTSGFRWGLHILLPDGRTQ